MRLPSDREVSVGELISIAESLALEAFSMDSLDEAEEVITNILRENGWDEDKGPYTEEDTIAVLGLLQPIAKEIWGALATRFAELKPRIKAFVEMKTKGR